MIPPSPALCTNQASGTKKQPRRLDRGVSSKHLQSYLDEFVFRYNNRDDQRGMFMAFLDRVGKASPESAS